MNKLTLSSNKVLMISVVSFSIWIFAILINMVADIAFMGLTSGGGGIAELSGFLLLFSAAFSLPGIIVFWIVFLLNCKKDELFSILLTTAFVTSAASVFIFMVFIGNSLVREFFWFIIVAVLAALGSVVLHYAAIGEVVKRQKIKNYEKAMV